MNMTPLWCAASMALACPCTQSHTSLLRLWPPWWPLTSGPVWWVALTLSASKEWQPSLPRCPPRPLQAPAPNCTTCRRRPSPSASRMLDCRSNSPRSHTSPSSRRRPGATNPLALTRPAAPLPPRPRSPPPRLTALSLRPTAWHQRSRSAAAPAQELSSTPRAQRGGRPPFRKMAAPRRLLSASSKNRRSWTRCILMMVSENVFIIQTYAKKNFLIQCMEKIKLRTSPTP